MLTLGSAHLQVENCQRCVLDHDDQRLELCHASVLRPHVLPARLWVLGDKVWCIVAAHYHSTDGQQHLVGASRSLGRPVPRVYPLRLALLGGWSGSHVNAERAHGA